MNRRGFFKFLGALGLSAVVGSQVQSGQEPVTSGYARVGESPKETKFFYDEYTYTASSPGYFSKDALVIVKKRV